MKGCTADFNETAFRDFASKFNRFAVKLGFASFFGNEIIAVALPDDSGGGFRRKPTPDLEIAIWQFYETETKFG
ncbi:hypothetical protein [Methylomarinum vadi]|uniref:hypothetical protein n=1 Tax=Methylomarinum vadi TaxID=438855 RepID=UPI0004DFA8B9|nr:hypothetical protein [Methylomarinum vadi]